MHKQLELELNHIIKTIFMSKSPLIRLVIIGLALGMSLYGISKPHTINADFEGNEKFCKAIKSAYEVSKTVKMMVTAYSSTEDQTDDTPLITASGKQVAEGIAANNMLPFGTKIRIPKLYEDKIFVIEDRMHQRKGKYHIDIWFSEYDQAKKFGAKLVDVEVLES